MHPSTFLLATVLGLGLPSLACESCEHPERDVILTRHIRRMQPDAENATTSPRGPLAWGQLNFLHTTDTHGWLEGHLKVRVVKEIVLYFTWYPFLTIYRKRTMGLIGVTLSALVGL